MLKTIKVYICCVGKQSLRVSLSKGGDFISALGRKMQVFMQNNKSTLRTEGVVFAFSIVSIWKRFTRTRCTCLRHEAQSSSHERVIYESVRPVLQQDTPLPITQRGIFFSFC